MSKSFSSRFNISSASLALTEGEQLIFKLSTPYTSTNDFTASISEGNLEVNSLSIATGYAITSCPYFDSSSIATGSNTNEIVFSLGVSSFYDENYVFTPNPLSGSVSSSLYPTYGDVDYVFTLKPFDIVVVFLSDNTYIEYRILRVYKGEGNLLRITLDSPISDFLRSNLANGTYKRFLLLTRKEDETNAYLTFIKRPGQTSYGFVISDNIATDILDKIDVITKEVKQKLLADQQGNT